MQTDRDWLLAVLSDGQPHSLAEILARSLAERGCGLTVHSRVSDRRELGHAIDHSRVAGASRGHAHVYQLVSRVESQPSFSPTGDTGCGSTGGTPSSQPTSTESGAGQESVGCEEGDAQAALFEIPAPLRRRGAYNDEVAA